MTKTVAKKMGINENAQSIFINEPENVIKTTMPNKNKYFVIILIAVTQIFLMACGQSNSNKNETPAENKISDDQIITLDTFSIFPPEIEGCSCYFSNDSTEFKKGEYIYMNDYFQLSFLKINGELIKFTQTDYKEIDSLNVVAKYKGDKYEMIIETKDGIQNGDETWLKTGTIKLTDQKGQTITKSFYGECGC